MFKDKDKEYLNNPDYSMSLEKFFKNKYYTNLNVTLRNDENKCNGTLGPAYPFSNEILSDTFEYIQKNNPQLDSVFCVGSSGDQALNAIYKGAKNITLVDVNLFTKYNTDYKIAAIKNLTFQQFQHYFLETHNRFDRNVYSHIFHDLDPDSQTFWGTIFLEQSDRKEIYNQICNKEDYIDNFINSDFYMYPTKYSELQKILQKEDFQIIYKTAEFNDFVDSADDQYDAILLSNIQRYTKHKTFQNVVHDLYANHLNPNGCIQLHYSYDTKENEIYILKKLFPEYSIETLPLNTNQEATYFIRKPQTLLTQNNNSIKHNNITMEM